MTSIDTPRGIITARLTITGTDFGATQEGSTVTIGGTDATVESWSDTSIVVVMPDLFPGEVPLVVTTAIGAAEPEPVRVTLPPRVYVENNVPTPSPGDGFDSITVLGFEAATGALTELAVTSMGVQPISFGGCVTSLVVHEGTRRLYAGGANGVAVFAIDPVTGMLTHANGSPFVNTDIVGSGLDVDAAGNRLWRAGTNGSITVVNISSEGELSPRSGRPFVVNAGPEVVAASRERSFVYAKHENNVFPDTR